MGRKAISTNMRPATCLGCEGYGHNPRLIPDQQWPPAIYCKEYQEGVEGVGHDSGSAQIYAGVDKGKLPGVQRLQIRSIYEEKTNN